MAEQNLTLSSETCFIKGALAAADAIRQIAEQGGKLNSPSVTGNLFFEGLMQVGNILHTTHESDQLGYKDGFWAAIAEYLVIEREFGETNLQIWKPLAGMPPSERAAELA